MKSEYKKRDHIASNYISLKSKSLANKKKERRDYADQRFCS